MKRKICKLLSIILTVILAFSCCTVTFTVNAETNTPVATYYVSPNGSDTADGTTSSTPLATVNKAIVLANAVGTYGADDTVAIKLIYGTTGQISWGESGTLTAHTYKLHISSVSTKVTVGSGSVVLNGAVSFENVNINCAGTSGSYSSFNMKGNSCYFASNVTFQASYCDFSSTDAWGTFSKNINYTLKTAIPNTLRVSVWGCPIFSKNVTYIIDNGSSNTINVGANQSASSVTYEKQLNVDLKSASDISIIFPSTTKFGENSAFQVINSSGLNMDTINNNVSALKTTTSTDETPVYVTRYILNNKNTEFKQALSFTDTAGVFQVAEGYSVVATKVVQSGTAPIVTSGAKEGSQDVVLDLTESGSGMYNLTVTDNVPRTKVIYVDSTNGKSSNNGLTTDTAIDTIANAVAYAKSSGYATSIDTLHIKTIGTTATVGTFEKHDFKVLIESNDTSSKTTISNGSNAIKLMGTVALKNIKVQMNNYDGGFDLYMNDFSVYEGVSFSGYFDFQLSRSWGTIDRAVNLYFGSSIGNTVFLGGNYVNLEVNNDVNVTVDNASTNTFAIGNNQGDVANNQVSIFSKNINFDIKNASSFVISNKNKHILKTGAAIQIINSANVDLTDAKSNIGNFVDENSNKAPAYIINNKLGDNEAIGFTDTAGLYTLSNIDYSLWKVIVKNSSGERVLSNVKNSIDLTDLEVGEYTVEKVSAAEESNTFFVGPNGDDANNGETKTMAFKTLNGAIEKLNSLEYAAEDVVNLKVVYDENNATLWGEDTGVVLDHIYQLNISSESTKATIGEVDKGLKINGPTNFENVNILCSGSNDYMNLDINGQNVTIGENVEFTGNLWNPYLRYDDGDCDKEINLNLKSAFAENNGENVKTFYIGSSDNSPNFMQDVNITVDNANINKFCIGGKNSSSSFSKNLNFVLTENAGGISLTSNGPIFQLESAIQILNSSNADISDAVAVVSALSTDYYIIDDNTERAGLVNPTSVAGTYALKNLREGEQVYAYKGEELIAQNVDNYITLAEPGEYSFVLIHKSITFNYDVNSSSTIAAIVDKAIKDGAIEGDKVVITAKGTNAVIGYGIPQDYLFDVEIVASTGDNITIDFTTDNGNSRQLKGDTKFDGVTLKANGTWSPIQLDGHDTEITSTCKYTNSNYLQLGTEWETNVYGSQTVKLGTGPSQVYLTGEYATSIYEGDVNVIFTNSSYSPNLVFAKRTNPIFNGKVNINLGSSQTYFSKGDYTASFNAGLNVITETPLSDSMKTFLKTSTNFSGSAYSLENRTGTANVVGFGENSGEFTVNYNGKVVVTSIDSNANPKVENGVVNLADFGAGNYFVGVTYNYKGFESKYSGYIDYRDALNGKKALNNFTAKVNNGEDVNVVYFGGSVTAGAGVTDREKYSWRGIVSAWLQTNAPKANVTNINSAIGDTGTWFGTHRLQGAVLDKKPDLLFIEFAINDYYNHLTYNEASQYFESILNWVRTALPECDIVTVLTTEESMVQAYIDNDALHTQAQAHYDICKVYGIPTIRVGHALADELNRVSKESGKTIDTLWSEYVSDIVHPKEKGYEVYANVIKEFLANSILADDATTGGVKDHILPSGIVNDSLLVGNLPEGNITFIRADSDLLAKSVALGGDSITVKKGGGLTHFDSYFYLDDTSKKIKFEFVGNELTVIEEQWAKGFGGVYVSIDGGAEQYIAYDGRRATKIATGLQNTKHTATVRIGGGDSGYEWIYGFYARNTDVSVGSYYVSESGNDSSGNGSSSNPYKTINKVIEKTKSKFGAGDTVYVKAIGSVAWDMVLAYDYNLSIQSANASNKATLNVTYGGSGWDDYAGDMVLDNIKLTAADSILSILGNNCTLGSGVETKTNFKIALNWQGKTVSQSQTLTINNALNGYVIMGSQNYGSIKWEDDLNIVVNNKDAIVHVEFHSGYGGTNTYLGNANFIFNKVNTVSFNATSGNASVQGTYTHNISGAVNVIIPNTASITDTSKTNITAWNPEKNYYFIVDEPDSGIFGFTKQEGVLSAQIGYDDIAVAENIETNDIKYLDSGIPLTSGKWLLDVVKANSTTFTENFDGKNNSDLTNWTVNATAANNRLNLTTSLVYKDTNYQNQYLSVDVKGSSLANGFQIRARINSSNTGEYYYLTLSNSAIKIKKAGSSTDLATTSFTFEPDKLYRVSFSVVNTASSKAILTAYIHDYDKLNSTQKLKAIDSTALSGKGFGFFANDSGVTIDNAYYSASSFRTGDYGWVENDINGDRDFDIRDLVYTDENKTADADMSLYATADKIQDAYIDKKDLDFIRELILTKD